MFPIESAAARRKVLDVLDVMFRDNVKGRRLHPNGSWHVPSHVGVEAIEAQSFLREEAERLAHADLAPAFEPLRGPSQNRTF